jgi:hypothetical protein
MVMGLGCPLFQSQKILACAEYNFWTKHQLELFRHNRNYSSKVQNENRCWPSRKIPWIVTPQKTHAIILTNSPLEIPP